MDTFMILFFFALALYSVTVLIYLRVYKQSAKLSTNPPPATSGRGGYYRSDHLSNLKNMRVTKENLVIGIVVLPLLLIPILNIIATCVCFCLGLSKYISYKETRRYILDEKSFFENLADRVDNRIKNPKPKSEKVKRKINWKFWKKYNTVEVNNENDLG